MSFDQYRPQGFSILPTVVKNLLIINALFFLATFVLQQSMGINLSDKLGLHYFASEKFSPYQIVTYMFMHGSIEHIFFNMFALWMFGNMLENYWGPKRFLTFYIVCGIGAAITHYTIFYFTTHEFIQLIDNYIKNPDLASFRPLMDLIKPVGADENLQNLQLLLDKYNEAAVRHDEVAQISNSVEFFTSYKIAYLNAPVVVGASGAIFGILLAFGMLFPNTILYFNFFIPIKAKFFVILYGAVELISGIYSRPGDNVAHFAHLGGMLFGFIMIMYWKKSRTDFY